MLRRPTRSRLNASLFRKWLSDNTCDRRWPSWQVVVGLEVHAQIKSRAKLFSHSWTSSYLDEPNAHVDVFDAAFPGTLPKLNASCVALAVRAALALDCQIARRSSFDRKHYFYSDLPAGYQITQHYAPLAKNGRLRLATNSKCVGIEQIQLEQDTAKSVFDASSMVTTADLNRAGTALMEIVSAPDMTSPEEAGEYVRSLQSLLRKVGASDCDMEKGSLRCDANVSVHRVGAPLGVRCEIKNLNSVRFMMQAITSEVFRHISILERGELVSQETRGFDENKAETYLLRSKEDAPDYRYMPDPNLPPLLLDKSYIASVARAMPELPEAQRIRLLAKSLSARDVDFLMSIDAGREVGFDGQLGQGAVAFFDKVVERHDPKTALNWITHDLYGLLAAKMQIFKDNPISVGQICELLDLVKTKQVTVTSAKALLKHMVETCSQEAPSSLAKTLQLTAFDLNDNGSSVDKMCRTAIAALPEEADVVRQGNLRVLNKLVGHVMKSSSGRADAKAVQDRLKEILQAR